MSSVSRIITLLVSLSISSMAFADTAKPTKTVVLVHGAWADGSCWNKVIPILKAKGLKVIAVQNPLTSLEDDVAAVKRVIDGQSGPIILVGHSWAGQVITEAGASDKVEALVYVAAFAPDVGDSIGDLIKTGPPAPGAANVHPDVNGFLYISSEGIAKDFAPDVSPAEATLIDVTQGPIRASAFGDKAKAAAWKTRPSWYIVADKDRMIAPDLERAMAKKLGATTSSLPTSHVPMLSRPQEVAAVILTAAKVK